MAALGFENYNSAVRSERSVVVVVLVLMLTTTTTTTVKVVDGGAVDECAQQLAGMATCLPYVGGEAMAPTPDCCSGLKQVLNKNKTCLCVIIQDRNDPDLGLQINVTLALGLPSVCHAAANISKCPDRCICRTSTLGSQITRSSSVLSVTEQLYANRCSDSKHSSWRSREWHKF
ncbi:non-specific lipid transfer protein GPI-anchored 14-like isoform X4 [Rosa rugosa]|uniref:non-specific lipid transfer protein GPI-anchored 14-like isoform X4 n=1 Tax=Rosa rugosa TaxID=74645 RepID=UPI002B40A423|nr:non-specific lipid transfer protein GPI-anchored 14-like isoform X4 [Rosa rugosa]